MKDILSYRLCLVNKYEDSIYKLYFTSDFENETGDDWDDRPASCNAGSPYQENSNIFEVILETPYDSFIYGGDRYSVDDLNDKVAPWLLFINSKDSSSKVINGGDTLEDVIETIRFINKSINDYDRLILYLKDLTV